MLISEPGFAENVQRANRSLNELLRGQEVKRIPREVLTGSWTVKQLQSFIPEFNSLPATEAQRRNELLSYLFGSRKISSVTVGQFNCVAEHALHIDQNMKRISDLHVAQKRSDALIQFSTLVFGGPNVDLKLHDAHVKTWALKDLPKSYQRVYKDEPEFTLTLEGHGDHCRLSVRKLQQCNEGFCRCVKLSRRKEVAAFPVKDVVCIELHKNSSSSFRLKINSKKEAA